MKVFFLEPGVPEIIRFVQLSIPENFGFLGASNFLIVTFMLGFNTKIQTLLASSCKN